ncbi:glutathione ABC transporter permease [Methanococcoides methylutens]|uniref:Glutathione ABC transporter permease n=2 Tax=Methanococcoides methylutens TaxID=2226 RepID=A0A099T2E3_METMT|nr:nickel ABC transporter permease [Methanococcoides methylutens]KGK98333.1 glutathione ABC transporter permease [Methanococcoides methylutens]
MLKYILKRMFFVFFVVIGVTLVTFSTMHFAPGDPAEVIAVARYGEDLTQEQIDWVRVTEGFDSPVYIQYLKWLEHVLHLDLGRSVVTSHDILEEITTRLPATIKLAAASLLISLCISIPVGIISAVRKNTVIDHLCMAGALLGVSIPNFWLGLLLIWLCALTLHILPSYGYGGIEHLVLPSVTLGTSMAAITTRLTRSSMLDVLSQEYIVTARAKGLDEKTIIFKHALKNAMLPIITFAGLQLGFLLGGSVIVETIFAWPGIGKLLVDSIYARDFAMVQGCVLFIAVIFALTNLAVDIMYAFLDPRIRYEKS